MNTLITINRESKDTKAGMASSPSKRKYDFAEKAHPLPEDYHPTKRDILCGRGAYGNRHPANIMLTELVRDNLDAYLQAVGRNAKSAIISNVLKELTEVKGARFVKFYNCQWYEMATDQAHDKIGHCLRDMIASLGKKKEKTKPKAKVEVKQSPSPQNKENDQKAPLETSIVQKEPWVEQKPQQRTVRKKKWRSRDQREHLRKAKKRRKYQVPKAEPHTYRVVLFNAVADIMTPYET